MIVQPDVAIAALRALGERDLAIVALVAGICDSEEDAIQRLAALEEVTRTYRKSLNSHDRSARVMVDGVIEMSSQISRAIGQVAGKRRGA